MELIDNNKARCQSIAETLHDAIVNYQNGEYDAWEQFEQDILDINYLVQANLKLKAVKLLVAFGGLDIWIDTETKQIELYWYNELATYPIGLDDCAFLDEIFEERLNCSKAVQS